MSYILDALRRLEQDKERSRRGMDPMEAVLAPDRDAGRGFADRRLLWIGIGGFALLGVILATYWVARTSVGLSRISSIPGSSEEVSARLRVVPHRPAARTTKHLAPTETMATSDKEAPAADTARSVQPSPNVGRVTGSYAVSPHVSSGPVGRPAGTVRPGAGNLRTGIQASSIRAGSPVERLMERKGQDVRISAIAWSRSRKDRFAVVNLKTVHEGDRVGDLIVYEIRQDGIVFQRGRERYRVPLGVH